jgi:hypothetical protein
MPTVSIHNRTVTIPEMVITFNDIWDYMVAKDTEKSINSVVHHNARAVFYSLSLTEHDFRYWLYHHHSLTETVFTTPNPVWTNAVRNLTFLGARYCSLKKSDDLETPLLRQYTNILDAILFAISHVSSSHPEGRRVRGRVFVNILPL